MKNFCITLLSLSIIILIVIGITIPKTTTHKEYLRIHVRANSNREEDQAVKIKVKDAVVEFLIPYLAECKTKSSAEKTLTSLLPKIDEVADSVLLEEGFSYKAKGQIKNEKFPTRAYGDLVLDAGYYDALILNLGCGEGDNWWCVVYPPLCFTGEGDIKYQSKIYNIIRDFKSKYEREE